MSSSTTATSQPASQPITRRGRFTPEEYHRALAFQLFNKTWEFLDKPQRTVEENEQMLAMAYASFYHRSCVGGMPKESVGHGMIARVFITLQRPEMALYHARRALTINEASNQPPLYIAVSHEELARALALNKEYAAAKEHIAKAQELLTQVSNPEDRKMVENDLATIPLQ